MKKIASDFRVTLSRKIAPNSVLLHLKLMEGELPEILPGQFVNILIEKSNKVFLRRPISICNILDDDTIVLMVKEVGVGSKILCNLSDGEKVNMILPLGKGFSFPRESSRNLLIGGGVGIAPLFYFGRKLIEKGCEASFLLGAASETEIYMRQQFELLTETFCTTIDGSYGIKGLVTEHDILKEDWDNIYVCGPLPMMKAVAKIARQRNINCEVSLENRMACGVGACLCCVEPTEKGNLCVCKEGPVFNINELKW